MLQSGVPKPATFHCLRHAFATQLLASGYDIRTIQELLGHNSVETIYTHVLNSGGRGVRSPLDQLTLPAGLSWERPSISSRPKSLTTTDSIKYTTFSPIRVRPLNAR